MPRGVEAEDDFGPWGIFEADALGADGNTPIGADLESGAQAPNIRPPRAARHGAQDRTFLQPGQIPGALRSLPEFTVRFLGVVVPPQRVDVRVGVGQFSDLLAGEIRWEALLPELVFALDFAFGLRRWSVTETNVVELEGPAQLGERLRGFGEKDAVIIDVELQRSPISQEGRRQEIEVGQEEFPVVEFGADKQTAAIVEHIKHREVDVGVGKPGVRGGVQLPEFADLGALPAPHRSARFFCGRGMGMTVLQRPMADLGAVEFEGVEAQDFRSGEAVGARWGAGQALFEEVKDGLRPRRGVVAPRATWRPKAALGLGASAEKIAGENVEATTGESELVRRFSPRQLVLAEEFEDVTNERCGVTVEQLRVLFISAQ